MLVLANLTRSSIRKAGRGLSLVACVMLMVAAAASGVTRDSSTPIRFVRQSPLLAAQRADAKQDPMAKPVELMHNIQPSLITRKLVKSTPLTPGITQVIMMEVTAYCPCKKCCGSNAIGLTASGRNVRYNDGRFVAADSKFKFGAKLIIPGYHSDKPVEVLDRGGAIKGDKLDVFFPTHQEAIAWGRKTIPVTVLN